MSTSQIPRPVARAIDSKRGPIYLLSDMGPLASARANGRAILAALLLLAGALSASHFHGTAAGDAHGRPGWNDAGSVDGGHDDCPACLLQLRTPAIEAVEQGVGPVVPRTPRLRVVDVPGTGGARWQAPAGRAPPAA